jgi:hypothetical protein
MDQTKEEKLMIQGKAKGGQTRTEQMSTATVDAPKMIMSTAKGSSRRTNVQGNPHG